MKLTTWIVLLGALLAAPRQALPDTILYVDDTATGANSGSGWCDAYSNLQDALAAAEASGGTVTEIRVAQGIYHPDQGVSLAPGDRAATFELLNGVALKGGYAGCGAPNPDERDIGLYETILSGDLNGDDGPGFANNDENALRVVTASGVDPSAILDGFTISGGNANDPSFGLNRGGGMYVDSGAPAVTNCTFDGNFASDGGGGMYIESADPTVTTCTFSGNVAAGFGGGMYNTNYSSPTLSNCTFSGNTAYYHGAGMYNVSSSPTVTNCTFSGNRAFYYGDGGGMHNYFSSPTVTNCTFSGNTASQNGGGIYNSNSNPTVSNCIFWGNTDRGGRDESAQIHPSLWAVSYSCVQGWMGSGTGNIGRDPLFADPDGADDLLGTPDDDLRPLPFSPCIDAGDNWNVPFDTADLDGDGDTGEPTPLDLGGSPRFLDDPLVDDIGSGEAPIVDMGAYESADCNGNSLPDWDDVALGTSEDCNDNDTPDECESQDDCNINGEQDICDIAVGVSPDCNGNQVPDECDIADGTSQDCNINSVPDDCEPDDDNDGVPNDCDECPDTLLPLIVGANGCPVPFGPCCFVGGTCIDETESADCVLVGGSYLGDGLICDGDPDGDWAYGCDDNCPLDPDKTEPGDCGCGFPDSDSDLDTVSDCLDTCPDTPFGLPANACGCTALGACCFAVGVCWDDTAIGECADIAGVYQGDGSRCDDGCVFGDLDDDGAVDLRDFAWFQRCFSGVDSDANADREADPACVRADLDGCGVIDLADFIAFRQVLTGP